MCIVVEGTRTLSARIRPGKFQGEIREELIKTILVDRQIERE